MDSSSSYDKLKINPHSLLLLINKYVKVQLSKNESVCGFIHAIDPIKHRRFIMSCNIKECYCFTPPYCLRILFIHNIVQKFTNNINTICSSKNKFFCSNLHVIERFTNFAVTLEILLNSIILLESYNAQFYPTLIPGHAILDVWEEYPVPNVQPPVRDTTVLPIIKNMLSDKKQRVVSWLKQNLLPVTESGDNIVFGSVMILPPYNISDVCTTNPIVAMQVKNIMKNMPDNEKES